MKTVLLSLTFVIFLFHSQGSAKGLADPQCQYDSLDRALPCLQGEFKGFGPTDQSPIALGELSIKIDGTNVSYKMATGNRIETAEDNLKDFRLMTKAELLAIFNPEHIDREFGLIKIKDNYPKLIFLKESGRLTNGIMFQGELADALAPTILFSPYLVKKGEFDTNVAELEKKLGKLPRLSNGGRVTE